jgi:cobalt-zinc-cadmium efflux system membrane fusion protein
MAKNILFIFTTKILITFGKKQNSNPAEELFDPAFLKNIEIHTVEVQNIEQQLRLTGKVDYDHDRVIRTISLVGGTVVSTHFHLGDRVVQGQTMAVIRSAELSEMEAERKSLEAEIATLQRELESVQSMYRDNLASQRELLEAQGQLKQAEASLEKALINLSLYGSSGSDGTFIIRSPIGGFVVDRDITAGMQIAAESVPLFVVADISRVWIIANVYAGDLAFVKEGMPVDIRTSAYQGEVFNGKIDVMSQVFDPEEHVLKARIIMPNADLRLKPEMAVDLILRDSHKTQMTTVPTNALIFDDNRYFVVKQVFGGFVMAEVKLHTQTDGLSYIEAGLEVGDRVVVKDNLLMYSKIQSAR